MASQRIPDPADLEPREAAVLALVAHGLTNKVIAARLRISARGVGQLRRALMKKLRTRTIAGLTRGALARGLIKLD